MGLGNSRSVGDTFRLRRANTTSEIHSLSKRKAPSYTLEVKQSGNSVKIACLSGVPCMGISEHRSPCILRDRTARLTRSAIFVTRGLP